MQTYKEILGYFIKKKKKCFSWSRTETYGYWCRPNYRVPETLMSYWYIEATKLYNLEAHYDAFRDCVECEIYYDRMSYIRNRKSNWDRTPQENGSFRKAEHHEKKVLDDEEIRKREWKKGFKKDKAKTYWRRGAGKYYKRLSNKMHRSFEREMIHHKRFDKLHQDDYKRFLDPWLWD